jgi:hypothetical protein
MNVNDIITRVQRVFGDESGVQITPADIIRWINDGQEEIVIANEGLMETTGFADVVQGQTQYSTPTDMSVLRSIQYNGYAMKRMNLTEFDLYLDGYNATPSPYGQGISSIYTLWQNTITLFPTPNLNISQGLRILYIQHCAQVATTADPLSVPVQYHKALVDFCLQQAYELDEDIQKRTSKKQDFDEKMLKLNDRNKWLSQEMYPTITTLPQDEDYGGNYGWWGGGWW